MKKSNWKRYSLSAATLAMVGLGVVGTSAAEAIPFGSHNQVIEAASVRVPVNIVAFDQYVLTTTEFDPLANVTAFGVDKGELVNLTDQVRVAESNVDANTPGTYSIRYEVTNAAGETAAKTVKVVVGVAPAKSLFEFTVLLDDLEHIAQDLELTDAERDGIQGQIDTVRTTVASLTADFEALEAKIDVRDGDIETLQQELIPLQNSLDDLYAGTVNLYAQVSNLEDGFEVHKALAESELARLEAQLAADTAQYEDAIAQLKEEIDQTGDGEQVKKLEQQVAQAIERFNAITKQSTDRIAEVSAEIGDLDRLAGQSEGRDEILLSLAERNKAEIDGLEKELTDVKAEREAILKQLQSKLDGKLSKEQANAIKTEIAEATEYYKEREAGLTERMDVLREESKKLNDQEAVYAQRLAQLREKMAALQARERGIEQRITDQLSEKAAINDALEDVKGVDEDVVPEISDEILDGGLADLPAEDAVDEPVAETPTEPADQPEKPEQPVENETPDTPVSSETPEDAEEPTAPAEEVETPASDDEPVVDEPVADGETTPATGTDVTDANPSNEIIVGEDVSDDYTINPTIPTIEDIMGEDVEIIDGADLVDADEDTPLPDVKAPTYVETEHGAGAGDETPRAEIITTDSGDTVAVAAEDDASPLEAAVKGTSVEKEAEPTGLRRLLPQTGTAFGALGAAGLSGIGAIAAFVVKRRRAKKD